MTHFAVIDLGYGDAGKGILTARLAATEDVAWVIRFSGGSQAAHNVITDDGKHHTFAQFGSGTFSGVKTFLSKYMMVEPFSLINEANHLLDLGVDAPMTMVTIDPQALMTTPYHWELNQWEEDQRGDGRHGSTGRGIGMTTLFSIEHPDDAPRIGDLPRVGSAVLLRRKLRWLREWCIERGCPKSRLPEVEDLVRRYDAVEPALRIMPISWNRVLRQEQVIFEGAQGVLLDQDYGFHPYTTWSKTTDANIYAFLRDAMAVELAFDQVKTIGVTRAYMTRHGAGPFVTEQEGWPLYEEHNRAEHYQGAWRQGYMDYEALRYALDVCTNIDSLYVTHVDAPRRFLSFAAESYVDANLKPVKLDPHLCGRVARPERQRQSEALLAARPLLVPIESSRAAESLSEALKRPLAGKGWGSKIGQGEFYD